MLNFKILSTATTLPSRVVTTAELAPRCGLSAQEAIQRTGVHERRWISGDETALSLGAEAGSLALKQAGLEIDQVDLLLNASGSQMQPIPDGASLFARELGLRRAPCYSLHGTCLSFLLALQHAALLIHTGQLRYVLIISAEAGSVALNLEQPESALLIGDGAAAVVLAPADNPTQGLEGLEIESYPEGADHTGIRGGGTLRHPRDCQPADLLFDMNGLGVLKLVMRTLPRVLEKLQAGLSKSMCDIDRVIPHQASRAGMELIGRYGWPVEQIEQTLPTLGNTIAASLPITLHQAIDNGRLSTGQRALFVGTGAGLLTGAAILRL